ncbi:MAG: hypothetical protein IJ324_06015 [Lachnospiraceae bacterium]|nr:hypothetical protein [Lachnospiraceae bacterium]
MTLEQNYYVTYMGKKCNIDMTDWNDGVYESYLLGQDERYVFYVSIERKHTKVGALSKQHIEEITYCVQDRERVAKLSELQNMNRSFFVNRLSNIYLEEKHFFSGLFGKETEILGVFISDVGEDYVKLITGQEIDAEKITKIETVVK